MRAATIFCAAALFAGVSGAAAAADAVGRAATAPPIGARGPVLDDVYAAPPAEERLIPFDAEIPGCDAAPVLAEIAEEFAEREDEFWESGLRIVGYGEPRTIAFRPWGDSFIPRRHCVVTAFVQDIETPQAEPVHDTVNYVIHEDLGILFGNDYDVEWCVVGVERLWHAAPNCQALLP